AHPTSKIACKLSPASPYPLLLAPAPVKRQSSSTSASSTRFARYRKNSPTGLLQLCDGHFELELTLGVRIVNHADQQGFIERNQRASADDHLAYYRLASSFGLIGKSEVTDLYLYIQAQRPLAVEYPASDVCSDVKVLE